MKKVNPRRKNESTATEELKQIIAVAITSAAFGKRTIESPIDAASRIIECLSAPEIHETLRKWLVEINALSASRK